MTTGREQKSTMGNFSRDAELWMHQARLIAVAIWTAVFISFLAGVGVDAAYFYRSSTAVDRYALERNVIGQLRTVFMMTKVPMEIYLNNEKQMKSVADVVELTGLDADAMAKVPQAFTPLPNLHKKFFEGLLTRSVTRAALGQRRVRRAATPG